MWSQSQANRPELDQNHIPVIYINIFNLLMSETSQPQSHLTTLHIEFVLNLQICPQVVEVTAPRYSSIQGLGRPNPA